MEVKVEVEVVMLLLLSLLQLFVILIIYWSISLVLSIIVERMNLQIGCERVTSIRRDLLYCDKDSEWKTVSNE